MAAISRIPPELRAKPEFQSAVVRVGIWLFGLLYIGTAAWLDIFAVNYGCLSHQARGCRGAGPGRAQA
jgi:hypothetical protein